MKTVKSLDIRQRIALALALIEHVIEVEAVPQPNELYRLRVCSSREIRVGELDGALVDAVGASVFIVGHIERSQSGARDFDLVCYFEIRDAVAAPPGGPRASVAGA